MIALDQRFLACAAAGGCIAGDAVKGSQQRDRLADREVLAVAAGGDQQHRTGRGLIERGLDAGELSLSTPHPDHTRRRRWLGRQHPILHRVEEREAAPCSGSEGGELAGRGVEAPGAVLLQLKSSRGRPQQPEEGLILPIGVAGAQLTLQHAVAGPHEEPGAAAGNRRVVVVAEQGGPQGRRCADAVGAGRIEADLDALVGLPGRIAAWRDRERLGAKAGGQRDAQVRPGLGAAVVVGAGAAADAVAHGQRFLPGAAAQEGHDQRRAVTLPQRVAVEAQRHMAAGGRRREIEAGDEGILAAAVATPLKIAVGKAADDQAVVAGAAHTPGNIIGSGAEESRPFDHASGTDTGDKPILTALILLAAQITGAVSAHIERAIRPGADEASLLPGGSSVQNGPDQIAIAIIFLYGDIPIPLIDLAAQVAIGADGDVDRSVGSDGQIFAIVVEAGAQLAGPHHRAVHGFQLAQQYLGRAVGRAVAREAGGVDETVAADGDIHAVILFAAADPRRPGHLAIRVHLDHESVGPFLLGGQRRKARKTLAGGVADAVDAAVAAAGGQGTQQIPGFSPQLQRPELLAARLQAAQETITRWVAVDGTAGEQALRAAAHVEGAVGVLADAPHLIVVGTGEPLAPQALAGKVVAAQEAVSETGGAVAIPGAAIAFAAQMDRPIAAAVHHEAQVVVGPSKQFQPVELWCRQWQGCGGHRCGNQQLLKPRLRSGGTPIGRFGQQRLSAFPCPEGSLRASGSGSVQSTRSRRRIRATTSARSLRPGRRVSPGRRAGSRAGRPRSESAGRCCPPGCLDSHRSPRAPALPPGHPSGRAAQPLPR